VGFQAAIVRVLPQAFHDPQRPCPGENMRFFNPLAVAFAVDTVISVNRIFLSARAPRPRAGSRFKLGLAGVPRWVELKPNVEAL
jgi:hypothetical protein